MATIQKTSDLIGIFDSNTFEQLFFNARPTKATINRSSQVMTHPVEDGSQVSDHQVFALTTIEIPLIISTSDYKSVYQSIKTAYEKSTLFTIQTKVDTFQDMIINQMPHEEDSKMYQGVTLILSFTEFRKIKPQVTSISPRNSKDSSNVNRGKQQGTETSNIRRTSLLNRITS